MTRAILPLIATLMLLGPSLTVAAECKLSEESVDPDSNKKILATKMVGVSTAMATINGYVQGVSIGEDKFLSVGLRAKNNYPIPPELGINLAESSKREETGRYDPRLDTLLSQLENDALFVPAGSTLRITMEDRSVVVLTAYKDKRSRSVGKKPQHDGNDSSNFFIKSQVQPLYALNEDALDALTSRLAISMRMETNDRYYEFASRMNVHYPLTWGKKNGQKFQEAVNCVL